MSILAVDLGTTNVKVAAFDSGLKTLARQTRSVSYYRSKNTVEFDADQYFQLVAEGISSCVAGAGVEPTRFRHLVVTGQAESLVLLGPDGIPLCRGISWLDMRSEAECIELRNVFPEKQTYQITGQPSIIPTWPITKMLWLRKNDPRSTVG